MKRLLLTVALALPVAALPACKTAPSARVVEVQTLKSIGQSADAAVALSAQLYRDRRISADQARAVLDFYNQKFQPVFRLAAAGVQANLNSAADPQLLELANQLAAMVASYLPATP